MSVPLTSVDGDVHWNGSQVEHARGWTVNPTNSVQTYRTNKTKGMMNRRPGTGDVTGSFPIYSTDGGVPGLPGEIAVLKLWVDGSNAWTITNAIITSVDETLDIETDALLGWTVNWAFAGDGNGTGGSVVTPDGRTFDKDIFGEVAES